MNHTRRPPPTVASVKEGLAKIDRSISHLSREVETLNAKLGGFINGRKLRPYTYVGPEWDREDAGKFSHSGSGQTPEPKRPTDVLFGRPWEEDLTELEMPTRILAAMARTLDGLTMDIRATRSDVDAIKNDSDERANLNEWIQRSKG